VDETGGGKLTIDVSRHGDAGKRKGPSWAKSQYEDTRRDIPWNMKCQVTEIPGLGDAAFDCVGPVGDASGAAFVDVVARKGRDVVSVTLIAGDGDPEQARMTMRGYARQVLDGM